MSWLKLGQWLAQKGENDRALLAFRAGLSESPDDPALQKAVTSMTQQLGTNLYASQNGDNLP
ncbi:MAG: tetratricopeptide repeat protein [Alphaproteobacteria bacterium]|nr:tetratricopeptide repeat protein [Alphaproteobacteria bacterium]